MTDSKMPDPVLLPDGTISINDCINHINNIYGTKYSVEREAAVARLWGFLPEDLNEDETMLDRFKFERETVELPKLKGTYTHCEIKLARAPDGRWAVDESIRLAECGVGACPGIWNRIQHPDRASALNAGLANAIEYCEKSNDRLAGKMLKILLDYKAGLCTMDHPDLFDML
jgi:hypothetical protein